MIASVSLCVEQLLVSRKHEERPDRDPVQGHREAGPADPEEQEIHHGRSHATSPVMARTAIRGVDRVFSCAGDGEQQEASHDAQVFIEGLHGLELFPGWKRPVPMLDQRCSERVEKHEGSREARERADSDREGDGELHQDRDGGRQDRRRQAVVHHLTTVPEGSLSFRQPKIRNSAARKTRATKMIQSLRSFVTIVVSRFGPTEARPGVMQRIRTSCWCSRPSPGPAG